MRYRANISRPSSFLLASAAACLPFSAISAQAAEVSTIVWTTSECSNSDGAQQTAGILTGLLGVVLGPLIEAGIKGLGDAIAKAGEPQDIKSVGVFSTNLYSAQIPTWDPTAKSWSFNPPAPTVRLAKSCLVIAAGPKAVTPKQSPGMVGQALAEADDAPLKGRLDAQGGAAITPELVSILSEALDKDRTSVLVASLVLSPDNTAFRIVPEVIHLGDSFDTRGKPRALSFTVSLLAPGALADGSATAVRTVSIPNISAARVLAGAEANAVATSWMPLPPMPDQDKALLTSTAQRLVDADGLRVSLAGASLKPAERAKATADVARLEARLKLDKTVLEAFAPYTFRADISQTRPGSPFLVKLGTFLSGNAEKVAPVIANALDPEKRSKAAETETQRVEGLRISAATELGNWTKAVATGEATTARVAEIKLRAACRQIESAGFADPACLTLP